MSLYEIQYSTMDTLTSMTARALLYSSKIFASSHYR